jgi:hypothetical protein
VAKVALETKAKTYPDGTVGLPVPDFARAFVMAYKRVPKHYIEQAVLPSLESRGLFTSERKKFLRIFTHRSWTRTPDGDQALGRLTELTTTAEREVGGWSEREPRRLASFLATAGGAALLVPAAYPVFEDFARRVRTQPDDGAIVPIVVATTVVPPSDPEPPEQGLDMGGLDAGGFDLGGLDLSAISLDFSGFAGLDSAFASIDAGVAAGVSSADGGAGGGGDGGSSSS